MGSVPLVRMDHSDPALFAELMAAVRGVASTGGFTLGQAVEDFEREFASYCGTAHGVGLSSGTEAIVLGLRALGVQPGSEVIVPANSFIATAEAVSLVGATPRLVDVDPVTHTVTAETIERNLTPRTACVIPVHLYGRMADMDPIVALARERGIAVLEDACQAHGAEYGGRRAGSIGDCGCFSFYPAKNLGAWGDGGALVTSDDAIAERVRLLRSHGERVRYHHELCGTTARLDAIQGAILSVKLRRLDDWNAQRRSAAASLTEALADAPVTPPAPVAEGGDHVFHQYVVRTPERDALREHLAARGVATGVHYPVPIHLTQAYAHLGMARGSLPVAERLADEVCSLPIFPGIGSAQIEAVAAAIRGLADSQERAAA